MKMATLLGVLMAAATVVAMVALAPLSAGG